MLLHSTGVEPVTLGSEDRCSIQLSYECERTTEEYAADGLNSPLPESAGDALLEAGDRLEDVLARVEGADAEVSFAADAEPAAGRDDDVRFVQQQIECFPTGHLAGGFGPGVGSVH